MNMPWLEDDPMTPLGEEGELEVVILLTTAQVQVLDRSLIFVGKSRGELFILDEHEMSVPVAVLVADGGEEAEA